MAQVQLPLNIGDKVSYRTNHGILIHTVVLSEPETQEGISWVRLRYVGVVPARRVTPRIESPKITSAKAAPDPLIRRSKPPEFKASDIVGMRKPERSQDFAKQCLAGVWISARDVLPPIVVKTGANAVHRDGELEAASQQERAAREARITQARESAKVRAAAVLQSGAHAAVREYDAAMERIQAKGVMA